jgi:hypothetical protein
MSGEANTSSGPLGWPHDAVTIYRSTLHCVTALLSTYILIFTSQVFKDNPLPSRRFPFFGLQMALYHSFKMRTVSFFFISFCYSFVTASSS